MAKSKTPRVLTPMDELRVLVRRGRLFDVQAWIAAGKPLVDPGSRKQQALDTAVETGFHSMVEVLAKVWPDQESLNDAFFGAVNRRRVDLVWLLMEHGADMKSVSLGCIAECFDKELMRLFMERWDIVGTEDGLTDIVTAKAYPLIGLIREYAPRIPNYRVQLGTALSQFIKEENLKWISLAIWMGADPRLPAPTPLFPDPDPDGWMTPMEYAVLKASVPALKILKPSAERDNLNALIGATSYWRDEGYDVAEYLISLGADINNKENGGSSILDAVLRPGPVVSYFGISRGKVSTYTLEKWVERGARWVPSSDYDFRDVRASIYGLPVYDTVRAMKALATATSKETLLKLFNTSKMCAQLEWKPAKLKEKIEDLYRPRVEKTVSVRPFVLPEGTSFKQIKPHIVEARDSELSRRELYDRVWSQSGVALGSELGISSVGLAKICKVYQIPIPGRGYWAKRYNRHKVRQKQLGKPDWNPTIQISTYAGAPAIPHDALRAQVQSIVEGLSAKGLMVEVPLDPERLHPLLEEGAKENAKAASGQQIRLPEIEPQGGTGSDGGEELARAFSDRARRLMNALLLFLESYGFALGITTEGFRAGHPVAIMFGEQITFGLRGEGRRLRLDIWGGPYRMRTTWRDGKSRYLESFLAEFTATLAYVAALNCSKRLPSSGASS